MLALALNPARNTVIVIGLLFGATACVVASPASTDGGSQAVAEVDVESFSGTVRWLELEGGFWGIETAQGKQLLPMTLPEEVQRDGLKVQGNFRLLKDVMTIQMWGTPVDVTHIEAIE